MSRVGQDAHLDATCAHLDVLEFTTVMEVLGAAWVAEDWHPVFGENAEEWWREEVPGFDRISMGAIEIRVEGHPTDPHRCSVCPREAWDVMRSRAAEQLARRSPPSGPAPTPRPLPPPRPPSSPQPSPAVETAQASVIPTQRSVLGPVLLAVGG
ncbi:MAG: hypothetical protein EHM88_06525, partial [Candidatus Rokuibacteriota bacterium]